MIPEFLLTPDMWITWIIAMFCSGACSIFLIWRMIWTYVTKNGPAFTVYAISLFIALSVFGIATNASAYITFFGDIPDNSLSTYNESQKIETDNINIPPALSKNIDPLILQ